MSGAFRGSTMEDQSTHLSGEQHARGVGQHLDGDGGQDEDASAKIGDSRSVPFEEPTTGHRTKGDTDLGHRTP
jgi:hypothetical protein